MGSPRKNINSKLIIVGNAGLKLSRTTETHLPAGTLSFHNPSPNGGNKLDKGHDPAIINPHLVNLHSLRNSITFD